MPAVATAYGGIVAYFLDLFTPATWAAFQKHGATISGFRERQRKSAERVKPGDRFLCYLVGLSRWCGVLEITSPVFEDDAPIFEDPDPFVIRFHVKPVVIVPPEQAVPILEPHVWEALSITRKHVRGAQSWAQRANLRSSLKNMTDSDGSFLTKLLEQQATAPVPYPLTPADMRKLAAKKTIRTLSGSVVVEVPAAEDEEEPGAEGVPAVEADIPAEESARESHRMQAMLAEIGTQMGFRIWIPRGDRQRVQDLLNAETGKALLDSLPLNYDDATLRTVEQIDVIWLKGRSMARAFEVEHTTAIYSGLLRMADLLALQPNMDIRLHIVAPEEKREKVLREIRRPVFSLLERGPLYDSCSLLTYDAVQQIGGLKHLNRMNDEIIIDYEERADDQ